MMSREDEFIKYDERIADMLYNIVEMTNIIRRDFERNGMTHPNYILEKLSRAKYDLDILVAMSQDKIRENEHK